MKAQPYPNAAVEHRGAASGSKGLVVIGATLSDAHVVSIFLLSMMLQERGYEVVNLSCCNATADFFAAIAPGRQATALVIANQNGSALADLQDLPALLREHPVPVILGGHYYVGCGSSEDIDRQLYEMGVACIAQTPEAMFAFLQGLERHADTAAAAHADLPQSKAATAISSH
jgi:methylmalonyl-CoA mutase cobalamin-binding subunit